MQKGLIRMRKVCLYIGFVLIAFTWMSCNEDAIDKDHSIFTIDHNQYNEFDNWLLANYTYPFNIDLKYRMQDIESDPLYNLIPADYNKSIVLSKLIKYIWLDAYTELAGPEFLRSYVPKTFLLIGSPAYSRSGVKVEGTAEGGKKITLYDINSLNVKAIDVDLLNTRYFKTLHHEFAHILNQKRTYDTSFVNISEGKYVGNDWYFYIADNGSIYTRTNKDAWPLGFVTAYAMSEGGEDFVENIAIYITHDQAYWDNMLAVAGKEGAAIIERKFAIVYNYMLDTWGINLTKLREIILRREQEIPVLDLNSIN